MAQPLQNITLGSPGFFGINTEDSPIGIDPKHSQVSNNCIIDRYGRIGARKGCDVLTTTLEAEKLEDGAGLVQAPKHLHEWETRNDSNYLFAAGNKKIFLVGQIGVDGMNTLTEMTLPVGYNGGAGITGDDWEMLSFNGKMYFFQEGHPPLVCDTTLITTTELDTLDNQSIETTPNAPKGGVATAAFGRLWCKGNSTEPSVLYWSDLFIGEGWTEGTSGSVDVTQVWPDGYDEITGVVAHNDRLVIFGKDSIVMYRGAESPATMVLDDTISGIGCIDKDTIKLTGNDVIFLSTTGLRRLSRTVATGGSLPMTDVSNNVRRDLLNRVDEEKALGVNGNITACYSPENAFYLLIFWSNGYVYCFDMRQPLQDGTQRVTTWSNSLAKCGFRAENGTLYLGNDNGVGTYSTYLDNGSPYSFTYQSPVLTFGDTSRIKMLKKIRGTFIGGSNQPATIGWSYGFDGMFTTANVSLNAGIVSEFSSPGVNLAEYSAQGDNLAEYSGGINVTEETVNATGSGNDITIRVTTSISGSPFSLQELNVFALIGKMI